tara:strand:- start:533 stop:1627 length:1095 start_codon:yes stop_codon:yes gene_type:complete
MNILITGQNGFIAKNLAIFFKSHSNLNLFFINKKSTTKEIKNKINNCDVVINTAGTNRSNNKSIFVNNNINFINKIVKIIAYTKGKKKILIHTSTTKVKEKTPYGITKKKSEEILLKYKKKYNLFILRLPNVFGKWAKPNYNSFIATICNNLILNKKTKYYDIRKKSNFIYIDDLCSQIFNLIKKNKKIVFPKIKNLITTNIHQISNILIKIHKNRDNLYTVNMNNKLERCLHSTYLSYLPKKKFYYKFKKHADLRGEFAELIKQNNNTQISYFTINPGQERGGHYHLTKVEKFIPISGKGIIKMNDINTNKKFSIRYNERSNFILDTIPGWIHSVKNLGKKKSVILVWSNEIFNKKKPDTFIN